MPKNKWPKSDQKTGFGDTVGLAPAPPPNARLDPPVFRQGYRGPFLGTLVSIVTGETTLDTELYLKPTSSEIVLHADSAHQETTKHNVIRNVFHRALNNSSNQSKEDTSVEKIRFYCWVTDTRLSC